MSKHGQSERERSECEIAELFSLVERSSDASQEEMFNAWARVNGRKVLLIVVYRRHVRLV